MFCNGNIVITGRNGDLMPDLSNIRTDGKVSWSHIPDVEVPVLNPLRQGQSIHHSQPSHASPLSETHRPQQELGLQHEIASQVSRQLHAALVAAHPDQHCQDSIFAFDPRWIRGQRQVSATCQRALHCRFRLLAGHYRGKKTSPAPSRAVIKKVRNVI